MHNLGPFFYRANFVKRHWSDLMCRIILIEHSATQRREGSTP